MLNNLNPNFNQTEELANCLTRQTVYLLDRSDEEKQANAKAIEANIKLSNQTLLLNKSKIFIIGFISGFLIGVIVSFYLSS